MGGSITDFVIFSKRMFAIAARLVQARFFYFLIKLAAAGGVLFLTLPMRAARAHPGLKATPPHAGEGRSIGVLYAS
jgi:hypothetical protein